MAVHIIDQSKAIAADFRHRALRHHAEGIFMLVIWTGKPASIEVVVPVVHRRGSAAEPAGATRSASVWISAAVVSGPSLRCVGATGLRRFRSSVGC